MAKPKLQQDFLSHFVECNGSINRPIVDRFTPVGEISKVAHVRYSDKVKITFTDGSTTQWQVCGQTSAYRQAQKTLRLPDLRAAPGLKRARGAIRTAQSRVRCRQFSIPTGRRASFA